MKIKTKFIGTVEIEKEDIISFPEGIPGFPDQKEFAIVPLNDLSPFLILQSINLQEVGFMVATPYVFKADYAFDLQQSDVVQLNVEKPEDVIVYGILTLRDTLINSTINLLAPVVVNAKEKLAKQIVLTDVKDDLLRYPLKVAEGSVK
ncbi:flagellar assembly protein FliW [Kurthia massiliensis]|uniref:flagellar assembly protein FliW n=1 Tax=Kurthia massiliensis TaxID=1033739 RepID=UPI000288E9FA|nr:flagellar assembly protein FliW [Kurthia massiliensis]